MVEYTTMPGSFRRTATLTGHHSSSTMKYLAVTLGACALAACGGGEHEGQQSAVLTLVSAPASAEGLWIGSAASGAKVALAVLENGEIWSWLTTNNVPVGAIQGSISTSGNNFSGLGMDVDTPTAQVSSINYSGTFSSKSSLSLTTSAGRVLSTNYSAGYDQPASLTALSGSFTGSGVTGHAAAQFTRLGISSLGVISGTGTGCALSGTATARPSGKNIFNLSLTFTGVGCALSDGAVASGIASYDATTRQLYAMALNASKSDVFIFTGSQP
jgi:hypothetical protein